MYEIVSRNCHARSNHLTIATLKMRKQEREGKEEENLSYRRYTSRFCFEVKRSDQSRFPSYEERTETSINLDKRNDVNVPIGYRHIHIYKYYIQGFLKLYQSLNGDLKSSRITCAAHIDKTNELRLHKKHRCLHGKQ